MKQSKKNPFDREWTVNCLITISELESVVTMSRNLDRIMDRSSELHAQQSRGQQSLLSFLGEEQEFTLESAPITTRDLVVALHAQHELLGMYLRENVFSIAMFLMYCAEALRQGLLDGLPDDDPIKYIALHYPPISIWK